MNTTYESTGQDDRDRERREGSVLWGKTKPLLDELEALRAAEVQRQTAGEQQAAMMRERKKKRAEEARERLAAAIRKAIKHRKLTLLKLNWKDRADFILWKRLAKYPAKYRLPADWKPTTKTVLVVRAELRAWEKQLGLTC